MSMIKPVSDGIGAHQAAYKKDNTGKNQSAGDHRAERRSIGYIDKPAGKPHEQRPRTGKQYRISRRFQGVSKTVGADFSSQSSKFFKPRGYSQAQRKQHD